MIECVKAGELLDTIRYYGDDINTAKPIFLRLEGGQIDLYIPLVNNVSICFPLANQESE